MEFILIQIGTGLLSIGKLLKAIIQRLKMFFNKLFHIHYEDGDGEA